MDFDLSKEHLGHFTVAGGSALVLREVDGPKEIVAVQALTADIHVDHEVRHVCEVCHWSHSGAP